MENIELGKLESKEFSFPFCTEPYRFTLSTLGHFSFIDSARPLARTARVFSESFICHLLSAVEKLLNAKVVNYKVSSGCGLGENDQCFRIVIIHEPKEKPKKPRKKRRLDEKKYIAAAALQSVPCGSHS